MNDSRISVSEEQVFNFIANSVTQEQLEGVRRMIDSKASKSDIDKILLDMKEERREFREE